MKDFLNAKYIVSYLYACGILWLISYWSTFDISIFEYINLTDIIKLVLQPLLLGVSSFAVMLLLSIATTFDEKKEDYETNDLSFLQNNTFRVVLHSIYIILLTAVFMIASKRFKVLYFPLLLLPLLSYYLFKTKFLISIFPHNMQRYFVAFIIVMLPTFSLTDGKNKSLDILTNKNYSYTTIQINDTISIEVKYLGKAGDYYIFLSKNDSIKYFKSIQETNVLELRNKHNAP